MNRKTDNQILDIPTDDIECWERYPKHRWVYELSRLLDSQNIKWSPFEVEGLPTRELNIRMSSNKTLIRQPGFIYIKRPDTPMMLTEAYITKGEIKLIRHIDTTTQKELPSINGEVELRISAFTTLYFQKFTGVMVFETYANEIYHIQLRPYLAIIDDTNLEVAKLVKRIYKKIDVIVTGLTDRVLQDSLAS
jgi:hypothetical protein